MDKKLVICDFDGTMSPKDMGYRVLKHFASNGDWESISKAYEAGIIGSQEAYRKASSLYGNVTKEEMIRYVESQGEIDPFFPEFYTLCTSKKCDVKIVSDGLDFYIHTLLKKYGLDIEYYANSACFNSDKTLSIEFPHKNIECNLCGNCKSTILRNFRKCYDLIIYIGDGYSDICPAQNADLVFAKEVLYEKLKAKGKKCVYFKNFTNIYKYFRTNTILD
ncbi:MAG: MtnX-like HAD-IB family phosphatase [Syntrophales bacterium]|jgi:2,3-diketo-5-methylthio-1-phosphopentane phosphatase|nr:MtnX-like HAD-IB family phosphatase [Syntrophales bacterium]MDY0043276.1 MtnX-like HAD-IB family phosphatase [Syntrophales bacterium]